MAKISGRALHFVFRVGDRKLTSHFYRNILGMKVLRHEEFDEGCEATCNGPYANRWSKTMLGYGSEDNHFAIEITYNYPIKSYVKGNDFIGITIKSKESLERAKANNWPILSGNILEAPGGFRFYILDEPQPVSKDPIVKVTLACSDLTKSTNYWTNILGLKVFDRSEKSITVGFQENQTKLELQQINEKIDRGEAYGRFAFSCPPNEQLIIDKIIKEHNQKILTPLISLDTPGKATVRVIILADPDQHEICFADDNAFRQLSEPDPQGEAILDKNLNLDKSAKV